ncbi:hypothetical protein FRC19_011817 [Serendipita sp. 401]|nr:hypothetical protein FRC19_011817 [Serendipita sp. 401]
MKGFSASAKDSSTYEHLTFIQEDPTLPNQRKKPRTLTACDRCRARKVKCEQGASSEKCDACLLARQDCSFRARDLRFHSAGVQLSESSSLPRQEDPRLLGQHGSSPMYVHARTSTPFSLVQRSSSRLGSFLHSLKRPASVLSRKAPSSAEIDPSNPDAASSSRSFRQVSRPPVPTAAHQQGSGTPPMLSLSSPPLPPANINPAALFDYPQYPTFPRREHMATLIPTFFEYFGSFFPFLKQVDITQRATSGRLWNIHALGIAALASRFSALPVHSSEPRFQYSSMYLNVAKPLINQYRGQMSLQALQGLIILSYAECGSLLDDSSIQLSVSGGNSTTYITEAVRTAKALGLGSRNKVGSFGVPPNEVIATWWSLMLIDELIAWNNNQAPLIQTADFDHQVESLSTCVDDLFVQLSVLSQQRRGFGRCLYGHPVSVAERNAAIDAMKTTYLSICTNKPQLSLHRSHLQMHAQAGRASLYVALHAMYYAVIFRFRLGVMAGTSFQGNVEKDAAVVSARNLVQLLRWCSEERRQQDTLANLFLESSLSEAIQVFSAVHHSQLVAGITDGRYLYDAEQGLQILRNLGSVWPKISARVGSLAIELNPSLAVTHSGLSPMLSNLSVSPVPMGSPMYSQYDATPPLMVSSSSYVGWNHSPSASSTLHASQSYYDPHVYGFPPRSQSRPSSPYSNSIQSPPYPHGQSWSPHPR